MLIDFFHCFLQTTDGICDQLLLTEKTEAGSSDSCDLPGQSEDTDLGTITNSEDTVVTGGNLSYLCFIPFMNNKIFSLRLRDQYMAPPLRYQAYRPGVSVFAQAPKSESKYRVPG